MYLRTPSKRPQTAAVFKDGKIERNLIVVSHNEERITTIAPYGTFKKDTDGVFKWLLDKSVTCKLNETKPLRK